MINAAESMKAVDRRPEAGQSASSIFGSTAILADTINAEEPLRIAVYPIICESSPDLAMGVASCLCYLLEHLPGVKVYRCFVKIEAEIEADDEDSDVTDDDYQFSPADWELEGLDDNLTLSGSADFQAGYTQLQLQLDASLLNEDLGAPLTYSCRSLPELISALPVIAAELVTRLVELDLLQLTIDYPEPEEHAQSLTILLHELFGWNLDLYLSHWGVEWQAQDIEEQFLSLADVCHENGSEFAFWCLGMACQQVMRLGLERLGEVVLPLVEEAIADSDEAAPGIALAAQGLSRMGEVDRALAMLEGLVESRSDAYLWYTMIGINLDAGRAAAAIDTCQRALEMAVDHPALYWQYAELLIVSEAKDWAVEDVLLIDPDDIDESEQIAYEIIGALKIVISALPDDLKALQLALMYMIDVDDPDLWQYFEQMVNRDEDAAYLGEIIERLADSEPLTPAYQILQSAIDQPARNPFLYAHLAQLALVDGKLDVAKQTLQACRAALDSIDEELELELQRLQLSADQPDFEQSFAEIKVLLNAKRTIRESDVEMLEAAIEAAPGMVDLYVTLARCYMSWKDSESAIEVLNEARERAGSHARIVLGLAQIQWTGMLREQAIATLNSGIAEFPNDVALLAQIASYLIENDQLDDARQFVERAESIAPSHGALQQLRRFIAERISS